MRYDENLDAWFCEEELTKYLPVDKHPKLSTPLKNIPSTLEKVEEVTKESNVSSEWKSSPRARKKSTKLRESEESEALVQEELEEAPPSKKRRVVQNLSSDDETEDTTKEISSIETPLLVKKITARKRAPTNTPPSKISKVLTIEALPLKISPADETKKVNKKPKQKVSKYFEKSPKQTKAVEFLSMES